ncbi:hypothetical protein GT3570_16240 [Geobacillus thermoleovorans]|uniref:hypothetical protein n=1 Tax=Geobacillus thermoleovorans TaxID=33941 RepID=UPI00078D2435|nr:hypothetical protein GT3570_16240 [Geobacillus thermoleovorans]
MIAYKSCEVKDYFVSELEYFTTGGSYVAIIVDPYYGGVSSDLQNRVKEFLDFIQNFLRPVKMIWFYNSRNCRPISFSSIEPIDLVEQGFRVHDRFLFLYDVEEQAYVKHFHLGGSLNSIDLQQQERPIPIMRISQLHEHEISEIHELLQQLETIYAKKNWGCS